MTVEGYVSGIALAKPMFKLPPQSTVRSAGGGPPLRAAIELSAVISFVDKLRENERKDVLHSVQLAQRAATARHNQFTETEDWYGKFVEVLRAVGWVVQEGAVTKHEQNEGHLQINVQALATLSTIASAAGLAVLQQALTGLERLAQGQSDALRLLQANSSREGSGSIQIGVAERDASGAVGMAMGAFYFRSHDRRRLTLFGGWGANEVEFWSGAHRMVLDSTIYGGVRDVVRNRLGTPEDYIARLDVSLPSPGG